MQEDNQTQRFASMWINSQSTKENDKQNLSDSVI